MINLFSWFKRSKMKREIIINVEKLETRVAVLENGRLEEFMVEHPEEERLVGSVFKGRVQNLQNDLQAAFIDIGLEKNAFLHYWDMTPDADALLDDDDDKEKKQKGGRKSNRLTDAEIAKRFPPGSEIIVQVTKGPISTKGPRVTANLSIPGRYLVMMPGTKIRGVSKKIGDADERKRLKKILDRLPLPENCGLGRVRPRLRARSPQPRIRVERDAGEREEPPYAVLHLPGARPLRARDPRLADGRRGLDRHRRCDDV